MCCEIFEKLKTQLLESFTAATLPTTSKCLDESVEMF